MNYSVPTFSTPAKKSAWFFLHYLHFLVCLSTSLWKLITTKKFGSHHGEAAILKVAREFYIESSRRCVLFSVLLALPNCLCKTAFNYIALLNQLKGERKLSLSK
jgi:hypothetical protein